LPNLKLPEMVKNFSVKSNDYMYVLYISSLVRSILSLHTLINNKINAKDIESEKAKMLKEEEEEKIKKKEEDEKKAAEKKAE
jgi:26S proteasome regulatory subunit N8